MASRPPGASSVLVGAAFANAVSLTPAVHAVFGLFLLPLSASFGWSRASISAVLGIVALSGAIVYPLSGVVADRRDIRPILLAGNLVFAAAIAALWLLPANIGVFYGIFTVIAVAGAVPNTAVLTKLVSEAYRDRVGTVSALTAGLGNGVGAAVMPPVIAAVIAGHGWRAGYLAQGMIVAGVGVPALLLMRRCKLPGPAPSAAGAATGRFTDLMRGRAFWLVLVPLAMGAGASITIFSHIVPILADRSVPLATAAFLISVVAIAATVGQIVAGILFDRLQSRLLILPFYLLGAVALGLFAHATQISVLMLAATFLGMATGTLFASVPFLVSRYFPPETMGRTITLMYSGIVAAQGLTPIAFDHAFDVQHTYRNALYVAAALCVCGALSTLALPPFRRARATDAVGVASAPALGLL